MALWACLGATPSIWRIKNAVTVGTRGESHKAQVTMGHCSVGKHLNRSDNVNTHRRTYHDTLASAERRALRLFDALEHGQAAIVETHGDRYKTYIGTVADAEHAGRMGTMISVYYSVFG